MVEPLALPTYALIALCLVATGILAAALGFTIARDCWPIFWGLPLLAVSAMLLRRVGHARAAAALEGGTLIYGQGLVFMLLLFPLSAISAPFADPGLDAADKALGFEWVAFAHLLMPAGRFFALAYESLNWQPLLVVVALCIAGEQRRMWRLVFASTVALAISTAIFPFLPAIGAAEFHGVHVGDTVRMPFGAVIGMLKGGDRLISTALFTGFISFPSYHAASGAILSWAAWPLKWLRWPLAVLNVLMCASAILYGGHYLVDMIAGLAVAAGSIAVARLIAARGRSWQNAPAAAER
jgi:membrane-associated phospholipid phosphatase